MHAHARRAAQQGFDYSYGALTGAVHPFQHTYRARDYERTWHRNGRRLDETGTHSTDLLVREAAGWVERQKGDQPWFLYLPFFAPHTPVDAPPEWKARYASVRFFEEEKKNEAAVRYAAMISQLDDGIGKVLAAIQAKGWRERTLVIFTSDNGPLMVRGQTAAPTASRPFPRSGRAVRDRSAAKKARAGKVACACRRSRIGRAPCSRAQ